MILDYSQFVKNVGAYGMNIPKAENRELFFEQRGFCSFCKQEIPRILSNSDVDIKTLPGAGWHKCEEVWECNTCGWWEHSFHSYIDGETSWGMKDWELTINSAILRAFDVSSKQVPIEILRNYIERNKEKIYDINDKKMEELVKSVFTDHYKCDIHLVGKSHDGGKDLILIESDKTIITQVKRRTTNDKTESVKGIRELIGATLLADSRDCIFVTTADHFSKEAIVAKDTALTKSIVDSFILYDFDKFTRLLGLYKKSDEKAWSKLLKMKK